MVGDDGGCACRVLGFHGGDDLVKVDEIFQGPLPVHGQKILVVPVDVVMDAFLDKLEHGIPGHGTDKGMHGFIGF